MATSLDYSQSLRDAGHPQHVHPRPSGQIAQALLRLMVAAAPHALAQRLQWVGGVNIGAFRAPGDGTSKDFGLALSYQPLSRLGVRAGSESGTAYELTQAEITAVAKAPSTRLRLIGMAGGAHGSKSPNGPGPTASIRCSPWAYPTGWHGHGACASNTSTSPTVGRSRKAFRASGFKPPLPSRGRRPLTCPAGHWPRSRSHAGRPA